MKGISSFDAVFFSCAGVCGSALSMASSGHSHHEGQRERLLPEGTTRMGADYGSNTYHAIVAPVSAATRGRPKEGEQGTKEEGKDAKKIGCRRGPQAALVSVSAAGLVIVILSVARDEISLAGVFNLAVIARNVACAFLFFAISDLIAQALEIQLHSRRTGRGASATSHIEILRAARTGLLGICINGVGYWAWVLALNRFIPQHDVDGDRLRACGLSEGCLWACSLALTCLHIQTSVELLACKALLDSCVWGTASNSAGIVGRRLLDGDSARQALAFWADKILTITAWELRFWVRMHHTHD